MKKQNILRKVSLLLAAALCTLSLVACGGTEKAGLDKFYSVTSVGKIDAMNWYNNDNYTIELNTDGTYQLTVHSDYFGGEDKESRGGTTSIFIGTYTSEKSEDGETSHLDVSLEAAERIIFEAHGKIAMGYGGNVYLDSANWTDAMTAIYDKDNGEKGAEDFLAANAKAITVTVEDPSLDAEDNTLVYRITEVPEISVSLEIVRSE